MALFAFSPVTVDEDYLPIRDQPFNHSCFGKSHLELALSYIFKSFLLDTYTSIKTFALELAL